MRGGRGKEIAWGPTRSRHANECQLRKNSPGSHILLRPNYWAWVTRSWQWERRGRGGKGEGWGQGGFIRDIQTWRVPWGMSPSRTGMLPAAPQIQQPGGGILGCLSPKKSSILPKPKPGREKQCPPRDKFPEPAACQHQQSLAEALPKRAASGRWQENWVKISQRLPPAFLSPRGNWGCKTPPHRSQSGPGGAW